MSEITRAEFDALRQKVEEIHRMLVNMGGQPNVIVMQPYPGPPQVVNCHVGVPALKGPYYGAGWKP
jgi:hypothetical protein